MDGHDKLQVAGFDSYHVREKWSGRWLLDLQADVVPSTDSHYSICISKHSDSISNSYFSMDTYTFSLPFLLYPRHGLVVYMEYVLWTNTSAVWLSRTNSEVNISTYSTHVIITYDIFT
jgi:hypothetical protein